MKLAIPIYEGVNLLDVAGPLEMFYWAGQDNPLETVLVSVDGGPVTSINGVQFHAAASFADLPAPDILWVPGGDIAALKRMMASPGTPYIAYIRAAAKSAQWVCSVCEGALLAAFAGLLDGHEVTTHWAFVRCLDGYPSVTVDPSNPRFVVSQTPAGNVLTGGGISSGLDEALKLIALLFGDAAAEEVQVTTQYFPEPPVHGRLPATPPACPLG